jgi:hypothetical protein
VDASAHSGTNKLLKWREPLRAAVIPVRLQATGETALPQNRIKLAVSNLPTYQRFAESIVEEFTLFELSKHM